ncbi:MAG TPA: trigger factor [Nitrospirae bacterium]|nr:trigger factor [Nitrospirota bacterium]
MLKNIEHVSSTKKIITVEIPAEELEKEIQLALKNAQKDVKLHGFRPGKVPISIIEKRFGKSIEADVIKKIVSDHFDQATKSANLFPMSSPTIEGTLSFVRKSPLTVSFKVDVRPDLTDFKYDDLTVIDMPVSVTDEDVMKVIENYAKEKANYEASDGPAEELDIVSFDCSSENNEVKEEVIRVSTSTPYPESFTSAFIGKKTQDKFEIEADFTNRENLKLNNMKGKLQITVNSVKKRKIPLIDDEFAKDLGFNNFQELFENVKKNVINTRNNYAKNQKIKNIIDKLLECEDFELPESQLEAEISRTINNMMSMRGDNNNISEDELRKEASEIAKKNLKLSILIDVIGEREGIKISNQDMEKELFVMSGQLGISPEELLKYHMEKDGSLISLYKKAYTTAVFDKLIERAKIIPYEPDKQEATNNKQEEDKE